VNVTIAEPPEVLEIVAEQLPAFWGVTRSVKVVPEPVGVPKVTIAAAPVPHADVSTLTVDAGTVIVTVTVCANAAPAPANVIELGETDSCPGGAGVGDGAATPVKKGGGFAPPPWQAANQVDASAIMPVRSTLHPRAIFTSFVP